ncbi:MAG: hypothetical protein C6Y22_20405 [Hapalosiphonaceae cyanobacterium JJU2]|nr:MAG: hypothetical protein C6Y22_20405 [Hapalosiphonaceae cyanobacterium JJU2]
MLILSCQVSSVKQFWIDPTEKSTCSGILDFRLFFQFKPDLFSCGQNKSTIFNQHPTSGVQSIQNRKSKIQN